MSLDACKTTRVACTYVNLLIRSTLYVPSSPSTYVCHRVFTWIHLGIKQQQSVRQVLRQQIVQCVRWKVPNLTETATCIPSSWKLVFESLQTTLYVFVHILSDRNTHSYKILRVYKSWETFRVCLFVRNRKMKKIQYKRGCVVFAAQCIHSLPRYSNRFVYFLGEVGQLKMRQASLLEVGAKILLSQYLDSKLSNKRSSQATS